MYFIYTECTKSYGINISHMLHGNSQTEVELRLCDIDKLFALFQGTRHAFNMRGDLKYVKQFDKI